MARWSEPGYGAVVGPWPLLVVLGMIAGCRTPPPGPPPEPEPVTEPEPEPVVEASTKGPAFVVLSFDSTTVVPLDPEVDEMELPGHWIGMPSDSGSRARGRYEAMVSIVPGRGELELPICVDASFDDPCVLELEPGELPYTELPGTSGMFELQVDVGEGRVDGWALLDPWVEGACPCVVVPGLSTDGLPEPEFDLTDPDTLEEIEMSPYEPEEYEQECGEEALRPDVGPSSYVGGVRYDNGMAHTNVCNGLNIYDGASVVVELRPGAAEPTDFVSGPMACGEGEADMAPSLAPMPDDEFYEAPEELPYEEYDEPVCQEEWDEVVAWSIHRGHLVYGRGHIATAGVECLCASAQPLQTATCPSQFDPCGTDEDFGGLDEYDDWWVPSGGGAALVVQDGELQVLDEDGGRIRTAAADSDGLLGVEFHPDTALVEALEVPLEVQVGLPSLAAEDLEHDGSAKQWGNRCFTHLKGDRLDAAEAACLAGLSVGGSDRTRGAITYSLGRVEEERGRIERARGYYQRSLRLRPGNATVEGRLSALAGK